MAGQFCFCGELRRGVDGDAGEQGAVEDASFGWFAFVVEVVEVDEEVGELVQACSGVGVVGLDEFEAFGFELVALGGPELAFVLAGSFELVEHVVEDLPDVLSLGLGQGVALVGAFDLGFGAFGVDLNLAGLASSGIGGADVEVAQGRFGGSASSR
ncbi:hypothetical protein [Dermabacter hominis]|uniref:hypothetical protein n=1 Tax=Dermabacter hominis TaxID=36740 RepID=UPI002431040E|nr:hypothetical protein [Dermabacter hominis]